MAFVDDIATGSTIPPSSLAPRRLKSYLDFAAKNRALVYRNSKAYVNRRVETKRFPDALLRKVLNDATFVQAHYRRYAPGSFLVEKMKYCVIHRPGKYPPACTLLNTVRTFVDFADGREASTHFLIGLNGEIVQMVDLADTSFHCGTKKTAKILNSNSVGFELEGAVFERFSLAQYFSLAKVIRMLNDLSNFLGDVNDPFFVKNIKLGIHGHMDFRSDKQDPGYNFNYALLASMIKDMPTTSKNAIFRPPVDPLLNIEESLKTIVAEAENPGSVGSAAILSATTQDAWAAQRAMSMSLAGRTEMAGSAATAAQRQAAFAARRMAELQQQIEMMDLQWTEVPSPAEDYRTYIDYDGAMGTYVDVTPEETKEPGE